MIAPGTSLIAEKLRGKSLFLTGGTGYVGKLILRRLKAISEETGIPLEVTALSRDPVKFQRDFPELLFGGLHFLKGDIRSADYSGICADFVLHGANSAESPRTVEEARETWDTTVKGTKHLVDSFLKQKGEKPVLLYLSSGAVYRSGGVHDGRNPNATAFDETSPLLDLPVGSPSDLALAYGQAKVAAEAICREYHEVSGAPVSLARIFACAGPYLPLEGRFALGQFIRMAKDQGKIEIRGDGSAIRTYLAGDELAEALLTLLVSENECSAYNVGSDSEITILETAQAVKEVFSAHGKDVSIEVLGKPLAEKPRDRYVPNIRKIGERFGLRPIRNSESAIRETVEWNLHADSR